jgi:hypothetical protein
MSSMSAYSGEIAAFGAVLIWTIGSQAIESAGRRVGTQSVNLLRLLVASCD